MHEVFMTEEQKRLREEVRSFVKSVPRQLLTDMDADKVRYPKEYLVEAGRRNLLGLRFPPKYGGRGLKWVDDMIALEEISALGSSLACLYSLVTIIGEALNLFGTEAQKQKYLRPTLEGKLYCAEALTEPRGGSDFFGSTSIARREGGHYVLNGQKRFIVGAEGADYFLVYAVTDPQAPAQSRLSAFIVDRDMGVDVKYIYGLMGTRGGGTGRIIFRDVRVPEENLLGEENGGSKLFYRMMIPERIVNGPPGGARAMLEIAARYADKRKAFGQQIRSFEAVSFKVAESITKLDAVDALVYAVAKTLDDGIGTGGYQRRLVSELKRFSTQVQWEVINDAMQILGGIGYTSVFPVERALRDIRLLTIWTGTNEVMNLIIQHEYYKELLAKEVEGRDVESDIPLTEAEAAEEKVYE